MVKRLTTSPAIPFDTVPNLFLRPRKLVGYEFSAREGLAAAHFGRLEAIPFALILPPPFANSLLECPLSDIHE
jgi:hypothetical protein